jgi:hypothetical protein
VRVHAPDNHAGFPGTVEGFHIQIAAPHQPFFPFEQQERRLKRDMIFFEGIEIHKQRVEYLPPAENPVESLAGMKTLNPKTAVQTAKYQIRKG